MTTAAGGKRVRTRSRLGAICLAGAATLATCGAAIAQPALTRGRSEEWVLQVRLEVESLPIQDHIGTLAQGVRYATTFDLSGAAVVFPLLEGSASHETFVERLESTLSVDNEVFDTEPVLLPDYQAGARLGRWNLPAVKGQTVELDIDLPFRAYELHYDEDAALRVGWPEEWPPIAASALQPQLFIDPEGPAVQRLVRRWTGGQPARLRPARLAKLLAARVLEHFQPSGQGYVIGQSAEIAGLEVHGSEYAAIEGEGSPHDFAALLCAVYRAAGLPARLVIGFDLEASLAARLHIRDLRQDCVRDEGGGPIPMPIVRSWVEFYLYDEPSGRAEWVPVDINSQRRVSSKARRLDKPWKFFGNNACFDNMAPMSFHFHPPTTVVNAGPPALWGWLPEPAIPAVEQRLDFGATEPPKGEGARD